MILLIRFYLTYLLLIHLSSGILYPFDSETRETKTLNGLWTFKISTDNEIGFNDFWYKLNLEETGDTLKMPVPASFNDITTNSTIRDFLGWSWYQKTFYVPRHWKPKEDKRVFIHFGGVHYFTKVWLNGVQIGEHIGGYLPFQVELTDNLNPGMKNNLTVAVNNELHLLTLPQATLKEYSTEAKTWKYHLFNMNCDYYNYGGINRPVTIFTTPDIYICGIDIETDFENETGIVHYKITTCGGDHDRCNATLFDAKNMVVAQSENCEGKLVIEDVNLWWPITTDHKSIGYMYNFQAAIFKNDSDDIYRLPIGIRRVHWNSTNLLINDESIYLHGLGMHEDSNIRGRGFDYSVLSRDLHLIQWLGANSFRTSHYPYAEETIHEADSLGILIIMEAPACSLETFTDDIYKVHEEVARDMISHFKNRPSIIMWSLANEPQKIITHYFQKLIDFTKTIDESRPVTFVIGQHATDSINTAVEYVDIICVNRYYGWYTSPGRLDLIQTQLLDEFREWKKFDKPVIISEYGAGSLPGFTALPSTLWTEDYHIDFMIQHFKAFDKLRSENSLIGEMVWNFIDFNVQQEYFRPGKCSKGLFTRERQPKAASYIVRARYLELAAKANTTTDTQCQSLHLGTRNIRAEPFIQSVSSSTSRCPDWIKLAVLLSYLLFLNYNNL